MAADVSFREALGVWLKVGCLGFGGPAGQIALMHRILVDEKKWIDEAHYLHALNFCTLLPGPEAQQLATYVGWLLHGLRGGLAAGILFVLPGAVVVLVLSALYAGLHQVPLVQAAFFGIKAAVLAVVVEALLRIARRALKRPLQWAIAATAFLAIFAFGVPFPLVVVAAAIVGLVWRQAPNVAPPPSVSASYPTLACTAATAALWLALWLVPVALVIGLLGRDHVFADIAGFFSIMATVTFGGAYAVLAYVAQQAVESFGWLAPGEMLDGLGLAETTPGPLILVTQFVGFLAAFRADSGLNPWLAGVLGAGLTTYVTFVPSFLWIFVGAPYMEVLRGRPALNSALTAITAAVGGGILNLTLWFALHVVFAVVASAEWSALHLAVPWPVWATLQPAALVLAVSAMVAMLRYRVGMIPTLGASAALGIAWSLV
ncbi:MAG: chromate efflux transporter [Alphaproteobacteria bacterium]|nr:chromate efflux transporter [Alphaproteobacteria bacterium]